MERGRDMYSAKVCKEDFLAMKKKVRPYSRKLERALERCNHQLLLYKRECGDVGRLESAGTFAMQAAGLLGELEEFLQELEDGPFRREVLEFYFDIRSFTAIYELVDENYLIYGRHGKDGRFWLKLCCVNPAANLQACLDKGRSAVFFSATLLPVNYYKKLLSGRGEEDYAVYIPSPFCAEKRRLFIGRDVSSRYSRRGPEEYRRIAAYIHAFTGARQGNYMVFLPSYQMLENVEEIYRELSRGEERECLCQAPSMREQEREAFLEAFREGREKTLVGFCVMGGIFAEGIDLSGEKLIGALVVGTGLPMVSDERELLRRFYDEKGENGFDYAYRFPGMNKVLQSAGRVIRTTEDLSLIHIYAVYAGSLPGSADPGTDRCLCRCQQKQRAARVPVRHTSLSGGLSDSIPSVQSRRTAPHDTKNHIRHCGGHRLFQRRIFLPKIQAVLWKDSGRVQERQTGGKKEKGGCSASVKNG